MSFKMSCCFCLLLSLVLTFAGCTGTENDNIKKRDNQQNGGTIVQDNDWIYYNYPDEDEYLYKMRTDGTDSVQLLSSHVYKKIVIDDWLYFERNEELRRVKTDGSEFERLFMFDPDGWTIHDKWLFYAQDSAIFKRQLDGESKTRIAEFDFEHCFICIVDNWIYYMNNDAYSENNDDYCKLFKMTIDGLNRTKISDIRMRINPVIDGDWIFFTNLDDFNLYRMRTDGTQLSKIFGASPLVVAESLSEAGDWLYFRKSTSYMDREAIDYSLSKMRKDGSDEVLLVNGEINTFCVIGDWIYYYTGTSASYSEPQIYTNFWRIKTDGSEKELLQ